MINEYQSKDWKEKSHVLKQIVGDSEVVIVMQPLLCDSPNCIPQTPSDFWMVLLSLILFIGGLTLGHSLLLPS